MICSSCKANRINPPTCECPTNFYSVDGETLCCQYPCL